MERKKSFIEIHEPEKYDSEKLARLSPHELFEGENSSLKKTFDEAVRDPMAEAILKDHSKVIQDSAKQSCKDQNDMMEKQFGSDYGFWRDGKYVEVSSEELIELVKQLQAKVTK
jgi:hypothetical protein